MGTMVERHGSAPLVDAICNHSENCDRDAHDQAVLHRQLCDMSVSMLQKELNRLNDGGESTPITIQKSVFYS